MLKQAVKQYLKRKCDARYENELHEKSDIYAVWYKYHLQDLDRQLVEKDHTRGKAFRVEVVRYSHLRSYILSGKAIFSPARWTATSLSPAKTTERWPVAQRH